MGRVINVKDLLPDEAVMWETAHHQATVPSFYVKELLFRFRGHETQGAQEGLAIMADESIAAVCERIEEAKAKTPDTKPAS